MNTTSTNLVEVRGLRVVGSSEGRPETTIVHDIDFTVARGEVLALIGESGSGKTTIALSLMGHARTGCRIAARLLAYASRQPDRNEAVRPSSGAIRLRRLPQAALNPKLHPAPSHTPPP